MFTTHRGLFGKIKALRVFERRCCTFVKQCNSGKIKNIYKTFCSAAFRSIMLTRSNNEKTARRRKLITTEKRKSYKSRGGWKSTRDKIRKRHVVGPMIRGGDATKRAHAPRVPSRLDPSADNITSGRRRRNTSVKIENSKTRRPRARESRRD